MKRRLLASILSLVMILSLLPVAAMANENGDTGEPDAYTAESSDPVEGGSGEDTTAYTLNGTCSKSEADSVEWKLEKNEDGTTYTLTIFGNGAMADYNGNITKIDSTQPWRADETGVAYANITNVVVTSGVTCIGMFAFNGLNAVGAYDIANTVTEIKAWGLDTQSAVTFEMHENANFPVVDGVLFNEDKTTLIAYPGGAPVVDRYEIPSFVTTIASGAFVGCDATEIVIPNTVKKVPAWTFSASTTKKIVFDADVESIGSGTFAGMSDLETFEFGANTKIETVGDASMSSMPKLTSIDLPKSLKAIGNDAFGNTSLIEITLPDNLQ